jgi:putative ABC transport system permease protein
MINKLKTALRALLRKSEIEREVDEELRYHIEQQTEQNIRLGMSPGEAHYAAQKAFGGVEQAKERSRDTRGVRWFEELWQDLRYGARMLLKNPSFTLIAVITLGLGTGATTAIFTLINATLLNRLPFNAPEQLVQVANHEPRVNANRSVSYPDFEDWRAQAGSFDSMAASGGVRLVFTGADAGMNGGAESLVGEYVSPDYFGLFGVAPLLGRAFLPEEAATNTGVHAVIVLSEWYWQRRFGGDPQIIGRKVTTTDGQFVVLGVMPASFGGLTDMVCLICDDVAFWLPASASSLMYPGWTQDRKRRWHRVIGRLKPGVSQATAQAELTTIAARLERSYPSSNRGVGARVIPLGENWRGDLRRGLMVLLMGAVFVLLIACANIANLLLARGEGRRQEVAVRLALGAGRLRIVRQLLTESVLLALIGGAFGVLLATWLADVIAANAAANLPGFIKVKLDGRALGFAVVVTALAGIGFGLAPAAMVPAANPIQALKATGGNPQRAARYGRFGRGLLIAEVALVFTLLVNAALMLRSFQQLSQANPGFRAENLTVVEVNPNAPKYKAHSAQRQFIKELAERLRALPGGGAITLAAPNLPPRTFITLDVAPEDRSLETPAGAPDATLRVELHRVLPNFFNTLGIPLVAGRAFAETDTENTPLAALISQSLAQRLWPGEDPVGKRMRANSPAWRAGFTVVGVVGDVKYGGFRSERGAELDLYLSLTQTTAGYLTIAARTGSDPAPMIAAIRNELREMDRDLPALAVSTVAERFAEQGVQTRFQASMLGGFALLAALLAAVGIYGVVSHLAVRRTHEIGVRMALGAEARDVRRLVIRQGFNPALIGLAIGLIATLALARLMRGLLFGISPLDPLTFAAVALLVSGVALTASYLPARRAAKTDPMISLRHD